jgi:hypothetical protein
VIVKNRNIMATNPKECDKSFYKKGKIATVSGRHIKLTVKNISLLTAKV